MLDSVEHAIKQITTGEVEWISEILRIKSGFCDILKWQKLKDYNYVDLKMNVIFNNKKNTPVSQIVEIQFLLDFLLEAKKVGHKYYGIKRKEIQINSVNNGAYGAHINTDIGVVLESICSLLDSNKYSKSKLIIRVGMTNRLHIGVRLHIIIECINHPNIFEFLHLPVQAGSVHVLDDMKRKYHRKDFENVSSSLSMYQE